MVLPGVWRGHEDREGVEMILGIVIFLGLVTCLITFQLNYLEMGRVLDALRHHIDLHGGPDTDAKILHAITEHVRLHKEHSHE